MVVHVRPRRSTKRRCGRCGVRAPGYDQGEGRRNWRTLDLGTLVCHLQADSPRVNCPEHGPTVAQVPLARHGAGHTREFDDQLAWLVTHTAKSTVVDLMRVAWRTVGSIISRVVEDGRAAHDPFDNLTRIGIDEISYKRGHPELTRPIGLSRLLLVGGLDNPAFSECPESNSSGTLRDAEVGGNQIGRNDLMLAQDIYDLARRGVLAHIGHPALPRLDQCFGAQHQRSCCLTRMMEGGRGCLAERAAPGFGHSAVAGRSAVGRFGLTCRGGIRAGREPP